MDNKQHSERTRELLIKHYQTYPKLQIEDIFKYIFQSAFGCEHLVSNEDAVLEYIKREYGVLPKISSQLQEQLDGEYSRVYLSWLDSGLKAETLAKLFCLSAKKEQNGRELLEQKLQVVKKLIADGELPFEYEAFKVKLDEWKRKDYPAIHHSNEFRAAYHPAYRVISNKYANYLQMFSEIDRLLYKDSVIVTIEGGSASGKTTLASILQEVYDCNVFHMDDFFLQAHQRTPERLKEVGGNVDRERFYDEILQSLNNGETVRYRRFDCQTQSLGEPVTVEHKKLTIVEGTYSMHPAFSKYYDLAVFLDIDPEYQRKRILTRNSPRLATRFFNEWIPLENNYFSETKIKERSDLKLYINKS